MATSPASLNHCPAVKLVPAFQDNYIFLLSISDDACIAVDPGDAEPVTIELQRCSMRLAGILLTHHHHDHVGGVATLRRLFNCPVVGWHGDQHRLPALDIVIQQEGSFAFGGVAMEVLATPGHTLGHISYYIPSYEALFCGDTLFSMGCGRLFEGTPAMMLASLQKLVQLPESTSVFCAHEYTLSNIRFARSLGWQEAAAEEVYRRCEQRLLVEGRTVPSTLHTEKTANPFLNTGDLALRKALGEEFKHKSATEVFAEIRSRKDHFR